MSVADAAALADLALGGDANLVRDYEGRRRPANDRSLRFTRIAARSFTAPRWLGLGLVLPSVLGVLGGRKTFQKRFLRLLSTTFQDAPPGGRPSDS